MGLMLSATLPAADAIQSAPAWTAAELSRPQDEGWLTNGGTLANQRHSPLQQINRQNVSGLKGVWHINLDSGTELRHNNQAQPLVYDGVIYLVTGQDDVFAISVDSGEILWEYRSGLKDGDALVCCQWVSRGVGLGEGKVFVGRVDGLLLALDQRTGKVLWQVQTGDPKAGYSLTAAPLYYNGMVIIGTAGGDLGIRGWIRAFDAKTGKDVWRFNTIPGPGEFGHDTWPADSNVWQWGGAPVWSTPAIDAELGLLYISTGNPGPSLGGGARPGDNLFTASILALDVATGQYRWHFQEVHHDVWDYDAPNPIILFEAEYNGVKKKGLAQAGKTGWVYLLDRTDGKPLIGINETPVMQEPTQANSPTQPVPVGDALVVQDISVAPEDHQIVNGGRIFTPFGAEARFFAPLAAVNWPPSAYDPATHLMYICASESANGARMDATQFQPPTFKASFRGGAYVGAGVPASGIYSALDVTTNRVVWQRRFNDGCRSGSLATAGGLVFVGRNDGRVTALDSSSGDRLWEFMTDAPVNSGITTFMHKGRQMVVAYAGGGFVSAKKGDGIWLFSLDGTLDPIKAPRSATPGAAQVPVPTSARTADAANGERIYRATCVYCHGDNGQGGEGGGKAIGAQLDVEGVRAVLVSGRDKMPAFGGVMSAEQLEDVATYVSGLTHAARPATGAVTPVRAHPDPLGALKSPDPKLAANKRLAFDLWRGIVDAGHTELADTLLDEHYIQHSPVLPTGRAAFKQIFSSVKRRDIPEVVEPPLVQILSEGNLVVMSLLETIAAKDAVPAYTTTHFNLFRIANHRLAEHWHSVQTAPGADVALPAEGGPQPVTGASGAAQQALLKSSDAALAANKRLVFDMWRTLVDAGHMDEVDRYLGKGFIEHSAGPGAVSDGFNLIHATRAPKKVAASIGEPVVAMVAEGDLVVLVTLREHPHPARPGRTYTTTWFDMFRVANGRLVEHWDAGTPAGAG